MVISSTAIAARRAELPDPARAADRLSEWTRERFRLPTDATILVSENASSGRGLPPRETVVALWAQDGERRQFRIFKPMTEVVPDDLPPDWMKDALRSDEGGCSCC